MLSRKFRLSFIYPSHSLKKHAGMHIPFLYRVQYRKNFRFIIKTMKEGVAMIQYKVLNEYLDNINLPKTIEEVLSHKYELEGKEYDFMDSANQFLKVHENYETYKGKDAHCMGTCLTDFTRVGIYFLLEDEIVTVNTSTLNKSNFKWEVFHFPFSKVEDLELIVVEGMTDQDYEAGVLYFKVRNDKGARRTHVLRNVNPRHFHCFEKFYDNIKNDMKISGS